MKPQSERKNESEVMILLVMVVLEVLASSKSKPGLAHEEKGSFCF